METKLKEAYKRIEFLENNIKSIRVIEEEYANVKKELQISKTNAEKLISELQEKHNSERRYLERTYEERLASKEERIQRLENEISELQSSHKKTTLGLENRLKKTIEALNLAESERLKLSSEAEQLKVELKHVNFNVQTLQAKNKEIENQTAQQIKHLKSKIGNILQQHKVEKESIEEKLHAKDTKIAELQKTISDLQLEKVTIKEEHNKNMIFIENQIVNFVQKICADHKRK